MFTKLTELTDVVSVLPFCAEDETWGLLKSFPETMKHQSTCQEYRLISVKAYHNDWRLTAYKTCKQLLKADCDGGADWCWGASLLKIIKIWSPLEPRLELNLHHAVFQLTVTLEKKTKIDTNLSEMGELTWQKDLKALKDHLITPEIIFYLSFADEYWDQERGDFVPDLFSSEDAMVELVKEDVLVDRNSNDPFDELAISAGFTLEDEIRLYEDYLVHVFPYCTMGLGSFTNFMNNLGWPSDSAYHLFQSADFERRGALLPKELLYLMAALEPGVSLSPEASHIRVIYIFRFYDLNNDGYLDETEFKALVAALVEDKTACALNMDDEVEKAYKLLGANNCGPGLSLDQLMAGLCSLQGSSTILRNSTKLSHYLASIPRSKRLQICDEGGDEQGGYTRLAKSAERCSIGEQKLKIDCRGPVAEQKLAYQPRELSKTTLRKLSRSLRTSMGSSVANHKVEACKLLKALNYFSKSVLPKPDLEPEEDGSNPDELLQIADRDSLIGKEAFAWGQITNKELVCSLMEVCGFLLNRFRDEPRTLQLNSPIHIMGGLYGSFQDVYCLEKLLWKNGFDWSAGNFLFLGGYVGGEAEPRTAPCSLELIGYLFAHKARNPDTVHMIRGREETRQAQKLNTFFKECTDKYGQEIGQGVWEVVNMVFDCMPVAAIVDQKMFCCYGGIPAPWICPSVEAIQLSVPCPLYNPQEECPIAWQLMANSPLSGDPLDERQTLEALNKMGFCCSCDACEELKFGGCALGRFLTSNGLCMLVRSEQTIAGYQIRYSGRMVSLASCKCWGRCAEPAVLLITSPGRPPRIVTLDTASLLPKESSFDAQGEEEEDECLVLDDQGNKVRFSV